MEYPEDIENYPKLLCDKSCLYILEVEPDHYKYGITTNIRDRLRTHYRHLNFLRIVSVFDCIFDSTMSKTGSQLGKLAASNGERIKKYDKTEIINTKDVDKYIRFVTDKIGELNQLLQPPNNRGNHIAEANHIAGAVEKDNIEEEIKDNKKEIKNKINIEKETAKIKNVDREMTDKANKCYSCGKTFKRERDLQRHKDRKTPCLIRDITDDIKNNPNRCIFCNKVFANKGNLNKHLAICKIKNDGMEVLADNVQRDQELKELRELREEMREMKKILQEVRLNVTNNTL